MESQEDYKCLCFPNGMVTNEARVDEKKHVGIWLVFWSRVARVWTLVLNLPFEKMAEVCFCLGPKLCLDIPKCSSRSSGKVLC